MFTHKHRIALILTHAQILFRKTEQYVVYVYFREVIPTEELAIREGL